MSLSQEWRPRVDNWRGILRRLCYTRIGNVPLSGYVTSRQLSPAEALRPKQAIGEKFRPMPPGSSWGAKWQYCWFRGSLKLPREAAGKPIVLRADVGAESRVLIDGREAGGRDWAHTEILLAEKGVPGKKYDILIEAYAGHGQMPGNAGPIPESGTGPRGGWDIVIPEPPFSQPRVGDVSFGIWEEEAWQLCIDVQTLLEVRDKLDANSLRVAEIDHGLRDFTTIVDLELPHDDLMRGVLAARKRLKPLLECTNGSTAPLLFCFGHSHIDVAWLWPLAETERKCARTFASQLALMDQYPEYKFLQSQAHLYQMTKRLYPELYRRIKAAVKRGQWIVDGGMWVEADTNVTGGESLIRQFIHGKRFYSDEFGVQSELMWLPDVFGYSGSMPQIMDGCGIKYFSTSKIFWNYNGGETFPYNTFWWEGIDGTRVLSHIHNDYNSQTNPATLITRWAERVQKDGISTRLVPYGWGDGGGGPTREHLEFLRRQRNLEGAPRTVQAPPAEYFHDQESRNATLPVYVGELYFQAHRGTYTTQARTKLGNRRSEFALRNAELWGAAAHVLARFRYPAAVMDEAWKGALLNQFHDIIPGSSIARVYEEANALYAKVIETAKETAASAAKALTRKDDKSVAFFNSLSWERTDLVPLPKGIHALAADEQALPVQAINGKTYAEVMTPSCGWTSARAAKPAEPSITATVAATPHSLENDLLRITFNDRGEIKSLLDKQSKRELATAPMNSFRMYKDIPHMCDAWDIESVYKLEPVELRAKAELQVLAQGPLAAVLQIRRALGNSTLEQQVWLRRGSRRVEFKTQIDWHEQHKLLKVNFPTTIHANDAMHEIQFGHLRRPNHASRQYDADRFEVCNQKWTALTEETRGAAVLNDCKYGVNVEGGSINLTLLKSSIAPDWTADRGLQEFTYAFYPWNGTFIESNVIREAYELNVPVEVLAGQAGQCSLFAVDAPNVIIETVKPAEDASGDVIVRLYEAAHAATRCTLSTALPVSNAAQCNMLEASAAPVAVRRGTIALDFRPFEIKTLRLRM